MSKRFTRTIEDFICEQCGAHVKGTGYTDHCPACLYGKHVDVMPGDRAEVCHGLLVPVWAESVRDGIRIHYRCECCGKDIVCKASEEDDFKTILAVMKGRR